MALRNKVAVVTGAANGIGRGIALALAARGARVACLDIDTAQNEATAGQARAAGSEGCRAYRCDIADPTQVSKTFDTILQDYGQIDILVNNAAVFSTMSFVHTGYGNALRDFESNMNTNARGTFLCAKKVAPHMARQGQGHILNVITNHMKRRLYPPSDNEHSYDASKWAQFGLNESLDCELKPYGVRVNAICPAATRTAMLQSFFDDLGIPLDREAIGRASGIASLMEVEDVAEAACHILEWDDSQPTGQAILLQHPEDCRALKTGYVKEMGR